MEYEWKPNQINYVVPSLNCIHFIGLLQQSLTDFKFLEKVGMKDSE